MDGMDTGIAIDAPEIDTGAEEVELGTELAEEGAEQVEAAEPVEGDPSAKDDPYTTKFSREMRAALTAWEKANPEQAKFAKQARDNHARIFALQQLEPNGISGVREKYALLDGLVHGDAKGPEALAAIQDKVRGIEEVDQMLAKGDPRAFEAFGAEFNEGLAKLAPAFLDRVAKANPQAFEAAMLPHVVSTLAGSPLLAEFNALIDVLNTQNDPRYDDKTKMQFTIQQLAKMGGWLNGLETKAGQLKAAPSGTEPNPLEQERTELEQERQKLHWDTKIAPGVVAHENARFTELFAPYQKRLKLDQGAQDDLKSAFRAGMKKAGDSDAQYQAQMRSYRGQRNPDPAVVTNFVKNAINRHAKTVMESLVKARYSPFLNQKPKPAVQAAAPVKTNGPVPPNVEVRTVKPPMSEIDHRNTPIEWLALKQYRLYSGKVVRVQAQG